MTRAVFTIVTPIRPGQATSLRRVLAVVQRDPANNDILPLGSNPDLHFASFVIFDSPDDGGDPASQDGTLVFEVSVDGQADSYLKTLANHPGLDRIYEHCGDERGVKYDATDPKGRFAYLTAHRYWPQLRHLGTPYRSAPGIRADREVRARIDAKVRTGSAAVLDAHLQRPTQGVYEYWTWEVLQPWMAWLLLVLTIALVWWFATKIEWAWPLRPWSALVGLYGFVTGFLGVMGAWHTWRKALVEQRARARRWIVLASILLATIVGLALIPRLRTMAIAVAHDASPLTIAGLVLALLAVLAYAAGDAVSKRRDERLATLRVGSAGVSPQPLWKTLKDISGKYVEEKPSRLRVVWHFRPWVLAWAAVSLFVWWMSPPDHRALFWPQSAPVQYMPPLVWWVSAAFAIEALWLAKVNDSTPRTAPWKFAAAVLGAGVVGFLVASLQRLNVPAVPLAALLIAAWFLLWGLPLPLQHRAPAAPDEQRLRDTIDQEDADVQNHMALMAFVDGRFQRLALRVFLWMLNLFFYRQVLPDLFRGKLFGLATVHCAQWTLLPDGRYLFLSNYDHSWTTYLDDFGVRIGSGIQKIWGQCRGNPSVADLPDFKTFVRAAMIPYEVWYRAYPGTSVRQIWNTAQLRKEIGRATREEEVVDTLRRLGAAPRVLPDLQHGAI